MLYIREVPVVEEDTNKSALGALLRTLRINSGFASKVTWTQSVQGAVATWSNDGVKNVRKYRMLITDQVATAPCTDRVQEWFRTFEASMKRPSMSRTFLTELDNDARAPGYL